MKAPYGSWSWILIRFGERDVVAIFFYFIVPRLQHWSRESAVFEAFSFRTHLIRGLYFVKNNKPMQLKIYTYMYSNLFCTEIISCTLIGAATYKIALLTKNIFLHFCLNTCYFFIANSNRTIIALKYELLKITPESTSLDNTSKGPLDCVLQKLGTLICTDL